MKIKSPFTKKNYIIWAVCGLHSFFLIFLTFVWINTTFMYEDEYLLIRLTSFVKRLVLHIESKPPVNKFLFVGVSWDKALIEKLDADGLPIGNQAITDRQKLAKFINILNKKPDNHKFLVIDIFFKDPTPHDSLLQAAFDKLQNYLTSYHKRDDGTPDYPILNVNHGLSDYENSEEGLLGISAGGFAKFKMIQGDSFKTLPLRMFEELHHKNVHNGWLYDEMDDKALFPTFVIDHHIRSYDLFEAPDSLRYDRAYLGELLYLPEEVIWELTKDRIVIVGDFEDRDLHDTVYGNMPGPLILTNAFLALENYDNMIKWQFILLLFAGYCMVSYRCFYSQHLFSGRYLTKISNAFRFGKLMQNFLGYFVFFLAMSLVSFFLFDVHLSILLLAVYMEIIDAIYHRIIRIMAKRRSQKLIIALGNSDESENNVE